jgi:hypothetical protein
MKLSIGRIKILNFSCKINVLMCDYKFVNAMASSIKHLGIFINTKLHFHNHIHDTFSRCFKLMGLVCGISFAFSSLECMHRLYIKLVRSKLQHAPLSGSLLRQLMATGSKASSRGLRPSVLTVSFLKSITTLLLLCMKNYAL